MSVAKNLRSELLFATRGLSALLRKELYMCTMIAHQAKIQGRGKNGQDWFEVREANVSYDHPYDMPLEHAVNIDFVNEAQGPGARVAVELSVEAARKLVQTIEAVLAQAEERGVLEDLPQAASR
jgi:hypothetical protein